MKRVIALIGVMGIVTVGGVAVAAKLRGPLASDLQNRPVAVASVSSSPVATIAPVGNVDEKFVYRDFEFGTNVTTAPTSQKPQSKLWYAFGSWWGMLLDPDTSAFHVYRLEWEIQQWIDTGTVLDERPFARGDVLWDGKHLYVASAGSKPFRGHAAVLRRLSYDPSHLRFVVDSGYPIQLSTEGLIAITIVKDTTGRLWVSYVQNDRIIVSHSTGSDREWRKPYQLPVGGTNVAADESAVVAYDGRTAIVWSNHNDAAIYYSAHIDGQPEDKWAASRTPISGLGSADDHLNLKTAVVDGEAMLFVAVKTSLDEIPDASRSAEQILLLTRDAEGTWKRYLFGTIEDQHTRPIVMIDEQQRLIYMIAAAPFKGGSIYFKESGLDDIEFASGRGEVLIASSQDGQINNPSSSKQNVSAETGLVVIASDDHTGRYLHAALPLGGQAPSEPSNVTVPDSN